MEAQLNIRQNALEAQHGVDFLVETLMAAEPSSVTLCVLGPMTNVAMVSGSSFLSPD